MDTATRERLIATYFDAIDAETYDRLTDVFTNDTQYLHPNHDPVTGVESLIRSVDDVRRTYDSTHTVDRTIHGADATVCEGTVAGEMPGEGYFEGGFVDVFEFDDDAEKISYTKVYVYNR